MYKIKQIPEDFIVKEIFSPMIDDGKYAYYVLKKRSYNTIDAIKHIAASLDIPMKFINFAGTKDRNAVTEQYISISMGPRKDLSWKDIELRYLGNGKERINLGSHDGNHFEITVRSLEDRKINVPRAVPNYFGRQRFGEGGGNVEIGRLLLKKQFKEALILIDGNVSSNPIKELKLIPKQLLRLYIHAFQSDIWNKAVSKMLMRSIGKEKDGLWFPEVDIDDETLPLLGFDDTMEGPDDFMAESEKLLLMYDITRRDFIIRQIPELSSDGDMRKLLIDVKDLSISDPETDELNPGKYKIKACFFLPKGCYATILITALFSAD